MDDFSIDQKKLPGVKEVCRDFAVLEDHCLAHNLQEQEIESHLASNVHKSRLVQQDLRVAKRLQEEEDKRAKAQNRRQHQHIERIDNEMAQEMHEQLIWQVEQQRQQEERDEVIARKLQEREMKEERKRQKQMEAELEEPYYEDKAVSRPPSDLRVQDAGFDSPVYSNRERHDLSQGRSPDLRSPKLDQMRGRNGHGSPHRHAEHHPAETSRTRAPEIYNASDTRGRHDTKGRRPEYYPSEGKAKYSEEYLSERSRHVEAEYTERWRHKKSQDQLGEPYDQEPVASTKERSNRGDAVEVDKMLDRERDRARRRDGDRERERDGRRTRDEVRYRDEDRSQTQPLDKDGSRDRNGHRHGSRDAELGRERDKRGQKHRSKDRGRDPVDPADRGWLDDGPEKVEFGGRQKVFSDLDDVFVESRPRAHSGEARSPGHSSRERGRVGRGEYGLKEATQGLAQIDIRHQELKDMEVARKLQEEELKASHLDKRAAQVAQDEEIARRLMEEEKREYKKSKEKQALERQQRRAEGDYIQPTQEDVVRPRTREEQDYQRARNPKPARPPPRTHNYENVDPGYNYSENFSPRPPSRPEAAYKGAYYRQ
ncbi:coiled-coil domain-containing protein 50 isoform X2 [Brachyhypopomus gauderio]|uniref:coiled-coil domain-containing protein 50 isoform X2 n=1 Tax=Brachyhypopomus gauderio TaxID=698409 RepID=UPI0040412FA6